ncbi:MAG: hypothetical protein QM479_11240 [Pseudomonadota bacterium]
MIKSVKKMMDGLSAQYAGDYLSADEKDKFLSHVPISKVQTSLLHGSGELKSNIMKHRKSHIAILCDDTTNQNVLNYVIENSNHCAVDILYHGVHQQTESESFYKQARSAFVENKVDVGLVKLVHDSIEEIGNYLLNQRTLQFLVTDSHDRLIKRFLKDKLISRQVNVPIVLIN